MASLRKSLDALADPFPAADVGWRAQSTGKSGAGKQWVKCLAYIDNRAIMDRLDDVCGPENWRNEFRRDGEAIMCGIAIKVDGEWVTKWDGAEETDIEAVKGGLSGAMKRAGYQWGIGRYLYQLEEGFGIVSPNGANYIGAKPDKHGAAFKWDPPKLPAWALPGGAGKPGVVSPAQQARGDAAVATLTASKPDNGVPAAAVTQTASHANLTLPGAKGSLHGYGGKRLAEVPTALLAEIRDKLKQADATKYAPHIAAIEHRIAEEMQPA